MHSMKNFRDKLRPCLLQ